MARGPIHPAIRFTSGKGDFIKRQLPDETIIPICVGIHNVDFFMACPAQVPGELMIEVIENDGQYSQKTLERCEKTPDQRCDYCYDKRKNSGKLNLKRITYEGTQSTKGDFERIFGEEQDPPFRIVRISKFTEGGHPIAIQLLIEFLELCKQFNVATVLPTKALPFGKKGLTEKVKGRLTPEVISQIPPGNNLAKLFKETSSAIYYSLGYEKMETGIISQGFTTDWRIQQAQEYHKAGARTSLTVMCDVTTSIKENTHYGSVIEQALKTREAGLNVRILPIRLNSRRVAKMLGIDWDKNHYKEINFHEYQEFLGGLESHKEEAIRIANEQGRYIKKSTESIPRFLHPDFKYLVEHENLGICGRIGEKEYCDLCNLQDNVRIAFPSNELIKVQYDPKLRDAKRKSLQRRRLKKGGQTLIFNSL